MIRYEKFTSAIANSFDDLIDDEITMCSFMGMFDFAHAYKYFAQPNTNSDIINKYAYAVYDDDKPVGFISCETYSFKKNKITCQIDPIAVFKDSRRKGYGTAILNDLKEGKLVEEKLAFICCILNVENDAGIEFLKKNKFKKGKKIDSDVKFECKVK